MMCSPITTHVLDLQRGIPAAGIVVHLYLVRGGQSDRIANGITNSDGRISDLLPTGNAEPGVYRLVFQTQAYFERLGQEEIFFPSVAVDFVVSQSRAHYHVPLLLSPFGYSTYRGS
jgi:5-hydroxyisourate hydrolase